MIREIKCPYGDDFEGGDECDRCEQYELCMESYPPTNLIEIPKEATIGDIIKIIFPTAICNPSPNGKNMCVSVFAGEKETEYFTLTIECWNKPYKQ